MTSKVYDWTNSEHFQEQYLQVSQGLSRLRVLLENVHCINCVQKIEKHFRSLKGVHAIQVHISESWADITWNDTMLSPAQIFTDFERLGFPAIPFKTTHKRAADSQALYRLAFAGFTMMNTLWLSVSLYAGADGVLQHYFLWIQCLLATPTLFYSGYSFLSGCFHEIKNWRLGMNTPVAVGVSFAWVWSCYTLLNPGAGEPYFDTVTNLIFLLLAGRFIEKQVRDRALRFSERKLHYLPELVLKIQDGKQEWVSIQSIKIGDRLFIRAGEVIPADGIICDGTSDIDESVVTGESMPLTKAVGDTVVSGSINLTGSVVIEATTAAADSFLQTIQQQALTAQHAKLALQNITDRILPYFIAAILLLAAITFVWWLPQGIDQAWFNATAVLVITCPCALGLSVPLVSALSVHRLIHQNILLKDVKLFEIFPKIKHIIADKTGTLTEGLPQIQQHWYSSTCPVTYIADLARHSSHPLSGAIVRYIQEDSDDTVWQQTRSIPGSGIEGEVQIAGKRITYRLGKIKWAAPFGLNEAHKKWLHQLPAQYSLIAFADEKRLLALFAASDSLRPDAQAFSQALKEKGIYLQMASGDSSSVCQTVAKQLNLPESAVHAQCNPQQKAQLVNTAKAKDVCAFIGDGINDAVALSSADIGITMAAGSGISARSASVVLVGNQLCDWFVIDRMSAAVNRTIKQNLTLALGYNLIMVPLAMAGWVSPLLAAVTMPISSLAVILNTVRGLPKQ